MIKIQFHTMVVMIVSFNVINNVKHVLKDNVYNVRWDGIRITMGVKQSAGMVFMYVRLNNVMMVILMMEMDARVFVSKRNFMIVRILVTLLAYAFMSNNPKFCYLKLITQMIHLLVNSNLVNR